MPVTRLLQKPFLPKDLRRPDILIFSITMSLFVCKQEKSRIPNGTYGSVGGRLTH